MSNLIRSARSISQTGQPVPSATHSPAAPTTLWHDKSHWTPTSTTTVHPLPFPSPPSHVHKYTKIKIDPLAPHSVLSCRVLPCHVRRPRSTRLATAFSHPPITIATATHLSTEIISCHDKPHWASMTSAIISLFLDLLQWFSLLTLRDDDHSSVVATNTPLL